MNTTSWTDPATGYAGMHNENIAEHGAYVGQQNGINYGQTTFHHYQNTYEVSEDDSPARKFEVAYNLLAGGMPRLAEGQLDKLIGAGHHSTRLAYYYALAVLGDRSPDEVDGAVHEKFETACRVAGRFDFDAWRDALDAIRLFHWAIWQETLDLGALIKITDRFAALPPPRRDEISRHLRMMLNGAVQDCLGAVDEQRVAAERMQPDRPGRAWKFFEPDPARLRSFAPVRTVIDGGSWLRAGAGGLGVLLGAVLFVAGLAAAPATLLAVPLLAAGGYLAIRFGISREQVAARVRRKDLEHGHPYVPQPPVSPGHWVSTAFVTEIHQRADHHFREARPHLAGSWEADSRGCREYVKYRLVALYGNAQVPAARLDWLIRWHAQRVAASWRSGTLYGYRSAAARQASGAGVLSRVGIGVAVAGLLVLLAAGSVGAAILLGAGGFAAGAAVTRIVAARRDDDDVAADNLQLLTAETAAYEAWQQVLSDRPTDAEMARWLDQDKAYLKVCALTRCGLTHRDLVAHVVMTEGARSARRAKVVNGPPRYSAYVVLVFLLTKAGVREIEVDLDFLTGAVRDERRTSFRYDALASARVTELGVRRPGENGSAATPQPLQTQSILSSVAEIVTLRSVEFRLTLLNNQDIKVTVENFREGADPTGENDAQLMRTALYTSGVASALHVLEAVAAEGRDWINREQDRRARRSQEWAAE